MRRFAVAVAVAVVGVAGTARAQVELAWQWKEGDKFYVETVTKVKQGMLVEGPEAKRGRSGGFRGWLTGRPGAIRTVTDLYLLRSGSDREVKQEYEVIAHLDYEVRKKNADGSAELIQRVRFQAIKASGVEKSDDTLKGTQVVLHVNPRGVVTKVEGHKELLDKLAGNDPARRRALEPALTEDALKRSGTQSLGFLPPGAVKVGGTWDQNGEVSLGPIGKVNLKRQFTLQALEGAKKDEARITVALTADGYVPVKTTSPVFEVTEGQLLLAEGKGDLMFNQTAGRLASGTTSMKVAGYFTVKNPERDYRTGLVQEQTVTIKVSDKPPDAPK